MRYKIGRTKRDPIIRLTEANCCGTWNIIQFAKKVDDCCEMERKIHDILESIDAIEDFVAGYDYKSFHSDRKTYSATLREFIVIGEAIANIPDDLKDRFPDIDWRIIKDFRNFIVHEYFGIDSGIVWDAVKLELTELKLRILQLKKSFPDGEA